MPEHVKMIGTPRGPRALATPPVTRLAVSGAAWWVPPPVIDFRPAMVSVA